MKKYALLSLVAAAFAASPAFAQAPLLSLPDASPSASVTQSVGMTDITIAYHRPAVAKRKIWGDLVPYNTVWRAGANQNTTITFSSPVSVGGKTLAAGSYGLHMLPTEKTWSVILSTVATAWGSFSYDPKEDAVRVMVTPVPASFEENLEYRFENPTETSVNVVMQWEKLEISFPISVDTKAVTFASLKGQLRGLQRFFWQDWNQAAQWCLRHDYELDQALVWVDRSIAMQPTFPNLRTKAALLEKKGDPKGAAALRDRAMKLATEVDINQLAYERLGEKKYDEAISLFRQNVKKYPDSWNTYDSLGEGLAASGDKQGAIENYGKALGMAPDQADKTRISDILNRLKKA